jgi:hypothetical protein
MGADAHERHSDCAGGWFPSPKAYKNNRRKRMQVRGLRLRLAQMDRGFMKIAILGAGNVALANACYLANEGHDVHLWSALPDERRALSAADGVIAYEGFMSGTARVTVEDDVRACDRPPSSGPGGMLVQSWPLR